MSSTSSIGTIFRAGFVFVLTAFMLFIVSGCVIERNRRPATTLETAQLNDNLFGIWVTRWDYRTEDDVREIIANASAAGFTDIYWQIRGQADAFYDSTKEPWGEDLTKPLEVSSPVDAALVRQRDLNPGFDPLSLAVREAHRQGVKIHAWMNVMPLWKGKSPPIDQQHLFHARPDWRLYDETGKPQPLADGYVVVNPVLDEVHDYLVSVVQDVVNRYRVDGIHLDYIRFLNDELGSDKLYPGDSKSLSLYARMVGDRATVGQLNRTKYRGWIRDRITHLVERIHDEAVSQRSHVQFSAAVWRHPDIARDQYLQDAASWVNTGIVDLVMPMIYTDDDNRYQTDLSAWDTQASFRRVIPGIGTYKHERGNQTITQAALGHPRRFALFAYSSIFESVNPGQDDSPEQQQLRAGVSKSVSEFIDRVGS